MRRTACTARPATSRTRCRTSYGSRQRAAAARITPTCETELLDGLQLAQQHLGVHRLDEVLVETRGERALAVAHGATARHRDQSRRSRLAALAQDAAHHIAVAVRESDVAKHDMRSELARRFDALLRSAGHDHDVAAEVEECAQRLGGVVVVFDY